MRKLDKDVIASRLSERADVHFYRITDSTNIRAKEYATENKIIRPAVFIAASQSAGRGRLGRSFLSEEGGIYFTLLMTGGDLAPTEITPRAAVAASAAIEELLGISVGIKWVNDLYLSDKKLAGILTEGTFDENGKLAYYLVGMGINVYKNADFNAKLPMACAIEDAVKTEIDINEIAIAIISRMLGIEELSSPLFEYRKRSILDGREIVAYDGEKQIDCRAIGIDEDFSLIAEKLSDGEKIRLFTGEVSVKLK